MFKSILTGNGKNKKAHSTFERPSYHRIPYYFVDIAL